MTTNAEGLPRRIDEADRGGFAPLKDGALPCGDCGQVVVEPDPATIEKAEMVRAGRATMVLVAKCAECQRRDQTSTALAIRYLRGGVTRDGRRYAARDAAMLLVDTRAAIDAAGMQPSSLTAFLRPREVLEIEIEHLGHAIRGLRWRERLSPNTSLVADPVPLVDPDAPNERSWAHLSDEDHARLRGAVAVTLGERVALHAPDVALVPPVLGDHPRAGQGGVVVVAGRCLYCGRSSVTRSALAVQRLGGPDAAARAVWTQRQVNPVALGARRGGPMRLTGWLCPDCDAAAVDEGSASSAGAMERALAAFLGVSPRTLAGDELQVIGLTGSGALVVDALRRRRPAPPSNADPWGHISKADRESLANGWRLGGS